MAIDPKVRSAGLHATTAVTASLATALWLASHNVDLYAIVDQINVLLKDFVKLATTIGALAGGAYQVWKSTDKNVVVDAAAVPGTTVVTTPTIAKATPEAPNIVSNTETKVVTQ